MDRIYGLAYTRRPHPSYREKIPAFEMIKDSVTIMRGCFGGCTFCSITTHQGRIIQSRSKKTGIPVEEVTRQFESAIPAGRFADAKEIAAVAAFLASPAASYVNGINMPVDGGRTACL